MLRRGTFSLVLIDADTPGLAIAEFARAARSTSPGARVLVIGKSSAPDLRDTAQRWKLDGYLSKPFTVQAVCDILGPQVGPTAQAAPPAPARASGSVAAALLVPARKAPAAAEAARPAELTPRPSTAPVAPSMREVLERLLSDTRARCILLITSAGYPVDAVGQTYGLHLATLGALIAATFSAAAELSLQLGNASDFRASHHQGPDCHIYTYEVSKDLLLATVFGEESPAGAVWLFAKRASAALSLQQPQDALPAGTGAELESQVQAQLDSLFDASPSAANGPS
jgi:CheY-like chemotaxis protein